MEYESKEQEHLLLHAPTIREEEPAYALREEVRECRRWLDEIQSAGAFLYIKRLSANDTGATESHQVGIYIPESVVAGAIPSINHINFLNPDYFFHCVIDSHGQEGDVRAVYYNSKYFGGTRNEARVTRWAWPGCKSPFKNPENTGALVVFSFLFGESGGDASKLRVWVCRSPGEEEFFENEFGEVIPGDTLAGPVDRLRGGFIFPREADPKAEIPESWATHFPTGKDILEYVFSISRFQEMCPDDRLIKRRELEYEVFRKVELAHVMPLISEGFRSVDHFIAVANSVANRRKSRSGRSLELHLRKIFEEEGLPEVGEQCVTEHNKKPDFIFPACHAYHDPQFPTARLRMLGVKTTCKDRWRQVLSEAERIPVKHLFTLQEGVSTTQYAEMSDAGICLVVPGLLHSRYPKELRSKLMTLSDFVEEIQHVSYS